MSNSTPKASAVPPDPPLVTALLERGSDLALICDENMRIRYAGPSLYEVFGYDHSSVVGTAGLGFVHPEDVTAFEQAWAQAKLCAGQHERVEIRVRHADGSWRWVEERITNLIDDPVVQGVVVNVQDVTERRRATDALARSEQLHRSILETAQEGVWVTDREGRTLFANPRMAELLTVQPAELSAGSLSDFLDPLSMAELRRRRERRAAGVRERYELRITRRDGEPRWLLIAAAPLYDPHQVLVGSLGVVTDITDRKELEDRLQRFALYDHLTGLPNRALLTDRLVQLQEARERAGTGFAVLACDVDRLKMINEARGLPFGDEVLTAVGQRLREAARDGDTVARFGGDEFVVLCPGADGYTAGRVAEALLDAVQAPLQIRGETLRVTVSIGVAVAGRPLGVDILSAVDAAVLVAKQEGRACVRVAGRVDRGSGPDSLELIARLRSAVEEGGLSVHYQPIVAIADGRPVGAEALMRWHDDRFGHVPPSTFIGLAEQTGLIPQLGALALRRACAEAMTWPTDHGTPLSVSVNVSPAQLTDPAIVDVVKDALCTSGLPSERLTLEVTETALLADWSTATMVLSRLRSEGVHIAIDDFGTGYSSLANLRDLPVSSIKIDRSFVSGLGSNSTDSAIVASIVSLASGVGLRAVAEGVETPSQHLLLRQLGCAHGQGYLWSPARPSEEMPCAFRQLGQANFDAHMQVPVRCDRTRQLTADPEAGARILELHLQGASLHTVAAALNSEGHRTPAGARWHRNTVAAVIATESYPGLSLT